MCGVHLPIKVGVLVIGSWIVFIVSSLMGDSAIRNICVPNS